MNKCFLLEGTSFYDKESKKWIPDAVDLKKRSAIETALDDVEKKSGLPVRLLVIDPVGNFLGDVNTYKDSEVRQVLMPLQELAERRGIAILLIAHHGTVSH